MPGLYVKLDAEYASDDKLIEAGVMAELLYVRGLAFAKRSMKDGVIKRSQLAAVGINIPSVAKHAQALVDVGAWTATAKGWQITSWLLHNKPASTINAEVEARKAHAQLMNHNKWHIEKPSPTCALCDPGWEQKFSRNRSLTGSPSGSVCTKAESEEESQAEEESKPSASSSVETSPDAQPADDDNVIVNKLIEQIATIRTEARCRSKDAKATYKATVLSQLNRDERDALYAFLIDKPHMRTAPTVLAAQVYDASKQVAS